MAQESKNIFLFYGEDGFSLKRKIDRWKEEFAKKYSPTAISFFDCAELGETELIKKLQQQLAPSLFSTKRLIILRDAMPRKADQENLAKFLLDLPGQVSQDFFVVFWQTTKPDGRLKFTKQFSALVIVQEFALPHGAALNQWIKAAAKTLDASISDQAADLLAQFLGRDLAEKNKEVFDLWQTYSELQKLASNTNQITPETVRALVRPKLPDSVFNLSDSLAAGDQKAAFVALNNYLETATGDEKSSFIKIIGLLSEQFRSLLLVKLAPTEKLGWTPGRVFILSKHAKNFSVETLKKLLSQLLAIDVSIKSSDANPRLLLDLFIAQK